ncbi:MAG: alpha-galactosidase [Bacteroidota bacterium]|nr:alpha-galactosidase [Bacteroidota bacterium]
MKKTKMLKSIIAGIGLIFVIMFHTDNSFAVIPPNHVEIEKWIQTTFAKGKLPPFSFVYQGISSADFIKTWDFESKKLDSTDPNLVNYIITYSDKKTGLNVDCHITGYTDFQAVEWVLNITNHSGNHSGVLEQVKALDYSIESKDKKPFILHHAKGSDYGEGIQDFNPYSTLIKVGDKLHFTPTGGRPSDKTAFPFYNIESPDKKGVMLSIGWTGNWFADFSCSSPNSTTVTVGQLKMKLFLYPEESIRTPEVCLLFWQGEDRMIGHNTFRRFILAHHSPKIDGKPITKLLSASFSAMQMPEPCPAPNSCLTEATALAFIDRYKYYGLTPDIFWMDAGWALGTGMPNDYATGAGNPMVDLYRFPNGLKPISEAAHKAGAKFMVWFEPERVFTGSWLDREHPNCVLKWEGNPSEMLDLGHKDAL